MGKLFSQPSIPAPVVETAPVATPAASTQPQTATTTTPDAEALKALIRKKGRADTILTSYRGVLAPASLNLQRKSLLGE